MVDRKLIRVVKRDRAAKRLQQAVRKHLLRRRFRQHGQRHKRITLEGVRTDPRTNALSEASAFVIHGREINATFKTVYTLETVEGVWKVQNLTRTAKPNTIHPPLLQVVVAKIREYTMPSRTTDYALLATTSRPVSLYVMPLSKVLDVLLRGCNVGVW